MYLMNKKMQILDNFAKPKMLIVLFGFFLFYHEFEKYCMFEISNKYKKSYETR